MLQSSPGSVTLNARVPRDLRARTEAFASSLGKDATLSDAVRTLLEAGLEVCKEPAQFSLQEALRAIDPSWSGKKPAYREPLTISTKSGRSAVDVALALQQGRK